MNNGIIVYKSKYVSSKWYAKESQNNAILTAEI